MPGLQDLQSKFERVERSGVSRMAQDLQQIRSERERYVNGDGQNDVLSIEEFFHELCGDVRNLLRFLAEATQTVPGMAICLNNQPRLAHELISAWDNYVENHAGA